jgi:hypothetical protein
MVGTQYFDACQLTKLAFRKIQKYNESVHMISLVCGINEVPR